MLLLLNNLVPANTSTPDAWYQFRGSVVEIYGICGLHVCHPPPLKKDSCPSLFDRIKVLGNDKVVDEEYHTDSVMGCPGKVDDRIRVVCAVFGPVV
jgi:hypothetical protein